MTIINLRLAHDRADLVTDELTRDPEGRPAAAKLTPAEVGSGAAWRGWPVR